MTTPTPDTFTRLHNALTTCQPITLNHADVALLFDMLGDHLSVAEGKLEKWTERINDYYRSLNRQT